MDRSRARSPRRFSAPLAAVLLLTLVAAGPAAAGGPPTADGDCALRRTEVELDNVAVAIASWLTDQVGVAPGLDRGAGTCLGIASVDFDDYPPISAADLAALLVPQYLDVVPELDGWGNPYDYRLDPDLLAPHLTALRSAGSDSAFSGTIYTPGFNAGPADDLVWADFFRVRKIPISDDLANQRRAEREIRDVGIALMSWLTDQIGLAPSPGSAAGSPRGDFDVGALPQISATDLAALLVPQYIGCLPSDDPWGTAYDYRLNPNLLDPSIFAVRSAGAEGLYEGTVYPTGTFPPDDFPRDVVWGDGFFVQRPDGLAAHVFADDFETGGLWGTWSCAPGL